MGVNLAAKNKIKFVNGLTHQQLDNLPPQTRPDYTLINTTQEWHLFFEWLENTQPQVLLIDGLCSLLDMGVSVDAATWFFECCQRIVERAGGRLVVAMYLDEFSEPLARRIVRLAHYVLSMQELLSGASSDVSGQLTAVPGHLYSQVHDARSEFKPISLHYRVSDTTVQFFSPGQSHTVL
ncbi:Elongator subunit elp6 [Coemansia sp. Benny D115]|nr:Elongator subunit elp6 [Coemansia sp. Benny D115]